MLLRRLGIHRAVPQNPFLILWKALEGKRLEGLVEAALSQVNHLSRRCSSQRYPLKVRRIGDGLGHWWVALRQSVYQETTGLCGVETVQIILSAKELSMRQPFPGESGKGTGYRPSQQTHQFFEIILFVVFENIVNQFQIIAASRRLFLFFSPEMEIWGWRGGELFQIFPFGDKLVQLADKQHKIIV